MSIHYWGEQGYDWDGISNAAEFIGLGLLKWRVSVRQWKEKFGEVRVYCSLGLFSFEQLLRPGHVYYRWPRWLRVIDMSWPARKVRWVLNLGIVPLHEHLYRRYYKTAVRKWPHLNNEILDAADFPELLKGLRVGL